MNLADIPFDAMRDARCKSMPDIDPLPREQLERLALQFARRERELFELGQHIDMQVNSLAALRSLLLRTLWPRGPVA